MTVRVVPAAFDPLAEMRAYQQAMGERLERIGACASFVGSMRDFNEGERVTSMVLEHYPGMTEKHLQRISDEAVRRWRLDDVLIVHRTGEVLPGEAIVLVAVWCSHRAHAFESCRFIMEDLKSEAPFWKKERTASGERWVSRNTPGRTEEFGR